MTFRVFGRATLRSVDAVAHNPDTHMSSRMWKMSPSTWYAILCFGSLGIARGLDESLVAVMMVQDSFVRQFGLDEMSAESKASIKGNIASMSQLGCIAGAIGAFLANDRIGRVWMARQMSLLWLVGVIVYMTSTASVGQLYAGKLIVGIALGGFSVVCPNYLAECCHESVRGFAIFFFGAVEYLGLVIGYFTSYGTAVHMPDHDPMQWKVPQIVSIFFAILALVLLTFAKESPRYLVKIGRRDDARKVLIDFRGSLRPSSNIDEEIRAVEMQLISSKTDNFMGPVMRLFGLSNLHRLAIAVSAQLLAQWSGATSITLYAPTYFSILGVRDQDKRLLFTALVGVVKLISALACAIFAIDRIGRKRSLIIGVFIQLVGMLYIAASLTACPGLTEDSSTPGSATQAVGISAIVFMYIGGVGYAFGWNSMQYLVGAELFPLEVRTLGTSVVQTVHYLNRYGLQKAVPKMVLPSAMGPNGVFWFFAGITCLGLPWILVCMPELTGVKLEDAVEMSARYGS